MDFDVKAWLTDVGFEGAELDEQIAKFTPRVEKVGKSVSRQADYSRNMDALRATEQRLKDQDEALTRELAEWAELKKTDTTAAATLQASINAMQVDRLKMVQTITDLATRAGVDLKTVLPADVPITEQPKPVVVATTDPNTFTRDQFAPAFNLLFDLPAELQMIATEHQALIGQPLDTRAFVAQLREQAKTTPIVNAADVRSAWEKINDIPAKRLAKVAEARQTEIKTAEDRGYQRARTEDSLPSAHPPGHRAPIFQQAGGKAIESKLPAAQRPPVRTESGATRAAAAYRTGKYRQQAK